MQVLEKLLYPIDLAAEKTAGAIRRIEKTAKAVKAEIDSNVSAVMERDPAAESRAEVLLLYSGVHAILAYRLAHSLSEKGHSFQARAISQAARLFTGIEIHPAAKIGRGLVIDHGTGVVIGETTEIGDYCTIYQGVTLGGTGKDVGKRHPTLGSHVLVGAGAKVLGPVEIGDNAKIAAGAVVLTSIPAHSTAVGIPAKVVRHKGERVDPSRELDQIHIPDPVAQELQRLQSRLEALEAAEEKRKRRRKPSKPNAPEGTP